MARENRNPNSDLDLYQALTSDPYRFGYYEALRQLECLHADQPRLGQSVRPVDDKIRLCQTPSLKFAPATLASFKSIGGEPAYLRVYFLGMFGPNGPLPLHLTEYARNRLRNAKDPAMVEFIDLFHHRLLSLFYRAWANKEPTVQFDRPEQDRFSFYLGSLLGVATPALQRRDLMPDPVKLHFAAHLAHHSHNAEGLVAIISGYFRLPVVIEEFIGEWLDMPTDSYCYLNQSKTTGQLGVSTIVGTRSWQCQHKFRIRLGPLSLNHFERLLPGGNSLKRLVAVVRNYTGFELNWDLNLILIKEQVPTVQLGQYGQLGWTSWLTSRPRTQDADDLYLTPDTEFTATGGT